MGRTLTQTVMVTHPQTREVVALTRGSEVPDWAEPLITNPLAFGDDLEASPPPSGEGEPSAASLAGGDAAGTTTPAEGEAAKSETGGTTRTRKG